MDMQLRYASECAVMIFLVAVVQIMLPTCYTGHAHYG